MISAINPDESLSQLGVYLISLPFSKYENTLQDLIEYLNHFQHYQHCFTSYFLKKKRVTNLFHC